MTKFAIFVDAANMFYSQKAKGWYIDYKKVLKYFTKDKENVGAFYFTATPPYHEVDNLRKYRRFKHALIKMGYEVIDKELKVITDRKTGVKTKKGNLDVELTFKIMTAIDTFDEIILFGGDSDFHIVLNHLKNLGKKVICIGDENAIAQEIINIANEFIDLNELKNMISK